MIPFPLLSIIVFFPLLGGLLVLAYRRNPDQCRWISLGVTVFEMLLVLLLLLPGHAGRAGGEWLMTEDVNWIEHFGIRYSLALDGISLVLILMTSFLSVLCVLVSWKEITTRVAAFHFFILFMQTGVLGVFLATDLFLFYLFWEMQVVPMFFLVGIWGHEKRIYATVKFVLFSISGSLLMLIALIALYLMHAAQTGHPSFSLFELMQTALSFNAELWLYGAFLLAFAIKIPLFPVHTWLPDAHTEAPTAGSVILAGLLLKTGVYALLRFAFPLFPTAARASLPLLTALGLIGLFYGAWIALAQRDMKRLVAYSSIAHMGLIVVGLAVGSVMTVTGAVLQMVNHGLTTSALFILVGMLDERTHSRQFADLGGIWKGMPVFSAFFLLFAMASLGLPGLNNFVGEILILVGAFREKPMIGVIGFIGMVLTLVYMLRLVQDSLFGVATREHHLWDITVREAAILVPLGLSVVWIGLHPGTVLDLLRDPVHALVEQAARAIGSQAM